MELDNDNDIVTIIVRFCLLLIIGIVLLSAIAANNGATSNKQDTFSFSSQPHDGDTITLDNHVFEFDNNGSVEVGHILVTIGTTLDETKANFRAAIQANTNYAVN
jgi:hypothetical protein